ncbi:hypothetical protein [Leptolyngbya iicbica]|uniref:Uncharacterized protein n=2 Tax=Cyanophyceae TaxID=3028117 RepID=A0A4Q7E742_9CYAN|nr:hypothetical protein [Leptolyngbya sp. LK]RZM78970.1 hypothetical protein DYY88_09330 [Leptolyngbya sp. LK]
MTTPLSETNNVLSQLERARTGDVVAIAALISQSFQRQGLKTEVTANHQHLSVSLQGTQTPPKQCVATLQSGLERLGVDCFTALTVEAYQQDLAFPAWVETIALAATPVVGETSTFNATEAVTNPPSLRQQAERAKASEIATYQPQWQALQGYLPPWLRDPKLFAAAFAAGLICLVLKPLILLGIVLMVNSFWAIKSRHRRQALSTALPQWLTWLSTYPWVWWCAVISLYCWVVQVQGLSYLGIVVSLGAIAQLLITILQKRRDHTAISSADLCLIANLHVFLLVLHGMNVAPKEAAPVITHIGVVVGLGLVMQLGYRLRSAAIVAHVLLTLSLLFFMFARGGPGLYTQFDHPYYDTQGYGIVFGLYVLVAALMYLGLIAISSFVLWGFGRGLAKNGRMGYACLLISPYLAWAFMLTLGQG